MSNEKEDKLKINNIGLGESITKIASQFLERIYHYDKRKENKIAVGDVPPPAKYAEWQDLWIDTSASLDMWNVQFIQSEHQTIYCIGFFGNRHSEDFQLKDGTPYTVEVIAEEGYTPGDPNIESGIIHSDIILYAETEATPIEYTIYIIQSDHQLIKVLVNGIYYTTDTSFIFGTSWSASIIPDPGYTAGKLNMSSGVLTSDITISATEAVINYYWIRINKYTHQRISVHVGDTIYTDDIRLPYGTQWSAVIEADEGYTAGRLNMTNGTLTQDITISATEEVSKQYTIHIAQYTHQRIIVTAGGVEYRNDITLPYGTSWSARVEADEGYTAGDINIDSGVLTADVWLTATESVMLTHTIDTEFSIFQHIIVTVDGKDYDPWEDPMNHEPLVFPHGTRWSARVEVLDQWIEEGYEPGMIVGPTSGILTEDILIEATSASQKKVTLYITQYEHQRIGVFIDSQIITDYQTILPYESTGNIFIETDEGYEPGTIVENEFIANYDAPIVSEGRTFVARLLPMTQDVRVAASSDAIQYFTLTIVQSPHQTITVTTDQPGIPIAGGGVKYPKGTKWKATITAELYYTAGKLNQSSGILNSDFTIEATPATRDIVNITIIQTDHQTISVTCDDVSYTENFTCYKGTPYSAHIQPNMWWEPGVLNIPEDGIFVKDTTVTCTEASIKTDYTLYDFVPVQIPNIWDPDNGHQWFGCVGANIDWRDRFSNTDGDGVLGLVDGYYILDMLGYYPPKHTPVFCFWGEESVDGLFKTMDLSVTTPDGVTHEIIKGYPNELFGESGDISPYNPQIDKENNMNYTGIYVDSTEKFSGWEKYINEELWETILNENLGKNLKIMIHINL